METRRTIIGYKYYCTYCGKFMSDMEEYPRRMTCDCDTAMKEIQLKLSLQNLYSLPLADNLAKIVSEDNINSKENNNEN